MCKDKNGMGTCAAIARHHSLSQGNTRVSVEMVLPGVMQLLRRRAPRLWVPAVLWPLAFFIGSPFAFSADAAVTTGDSVVPQQMQTGSLLLKMQSGYTTATRINTSVDIRISGPVARTTVSQAFRNDGSEWVEAVYVFPLPDTAAVDRLRLRAGERLVEGEIREKEEARKEYEQAKDSGRRSGLIEQQRANLFTTSLANLAPGETIVIEIEYLETLDYDNGTFSLRFPLTLTPRYIPGEPLPERRGSGWSPDTNRVPDASLVTPPVVTRSENHKVTMHAEIDAGVPLELIASRYHPINMTAVDEQSGRFLVTLKDRVSMDHDLELIWRPVPEAAPRAALFRESIGGEPYYLLMMLPPHGIAEDQPDRSAMPRELVLVVDTSGSMHGTSIEQAKKALLLALDGLRPQDRFNIIQFNSVTDALFAGSVGASAANLQKARLYVQSLNADGGTEMRPALARALQGAGPEIHLRQVVFITDGSVGNETELFSLISAKLGDARLFTVGIGSAPNSWFMRKAAEAGRGTYTFVSELHEVKEKMEALLRKLERPQVTGIEVKWPGSVLVYPDIVPDLYAGEPIVQTARLAAPPRAGDVVRASGTSAEGDWAAEMPLVIDQDSAGVAAVWARARIEHLLDDERRGVRTERIRAAVIETALAHHLVSRYTSLVAVDKSPVRPDGTLVNGEQVPNLLPYGQSQRAIFGFPETATGWKVRLSIGAFLLLLGLSLVPGRVGAESSDVRTPA
jgi:Ca-activated chloride channel homolog